MADVLNVINTSRIAWGLSTLAMQFGARYVVTDLTDMQTRVLASAVGKRLVMCGMIFVATRDIMLSVVMTMGIHAVLAIFFNEKSAYCIVPATMQGVQIEAGTEKEITKAQYDEALLTVQRYQEQERGQEREQRRSLRNHHRAPRMFHLL
jgi:hypothetical protein